VADHEGDWDHRGIYVEYGTFRLYQGVGTIGSGKSLSVPTEQLDQAIERMAGFHALPPPRSYHRRYLDRRQRVEEGERSLRRGAAFKLMQPLSGF
jgi:hypothetical protein